LRYPLHFQLLERLVQVPKAIRPAPDVDQMALVQQPVQQRRGHHLIPGQHLGPVLDGLVGGDQGGPPLVPVGLRPRNGVGG